MRNADTRAKATGLRPPASNVLYPGLPVAAMPDAIAGWRQTTIEDELIQLSGWVPAADIGHIYEPEYDAAWTCEAAVASNALVFDLTGRAFGRVKDSNVAACTLDASPTKTGRRPFHLRRMNLDATGSRRLFDLVGYVDPSSLTTDGTEGIGLLTGMRETYISHADNLPTNTALFASPESELVGKTTDTVQIVSTGRNQGEWRQSNVVTGAGFIPLWWKKGGASEGKSE
jgi:hypothetical protein